MSGSKLLERISNNKLTKAMGVKRIAVVMRWSRLRWFGHVHRREEGEWIRKVCELQVQGRRPEGRPRKTWTRWRNVVEENLRVLRRKE